MRTLIYYTNCPVCGSEKLGQVLSAKDHTVSGETFAIVECGHCSLRFTQDVPDAASISPYYKSENYISHTNTSKGLVNTLYQSVRKHTLKQKRKLVEKVTGVKNGHLLDMGAGTGAFAHTMKEAGWTVTALEPDTDARAVAKELHGLEAEDTSLFYTLTPGAYDAITLWHVLEHVHDLQAYVQQLKALLKPNGKLIIAVPNYMAKDAALYKEYWAAYDVPRHLYHFSPQAMLKLMESHGLTISGYRPMWFDSFYICLLSSRYKHGRARLIPAFWNGLRSNMQAWGNVKKCSSVIYIIGR